MKTITPLERAWHLCGGLYGLAKVCGVTNTSTHRWKKKGTLPRTEWTGETHYAEKIEAATQGAITKDELLAHRPIRAPRKTPTPPSE